MSVTNITVHYSFGGYVTSVAVITTHSEGVVNFYTKKTNCVTFP